MARITTTLSEAKERARRAHRAARDGDTIRAAIYDRWLADTLSAAAGRDAAIAGTMFTGLAIAPEVMVDMKGWPSGIVAGFTPARRVGLINHSARFPSPNPSDRAKCGRCGDLDVEACGGNMSRSAEVMARAVALQAGEFFDCVAESEKDIKPTELIAAADHADRVAGQLARARGRNRS